MVTGNGDRSGNGRKIIIRGSTDTKSMSLGHCGNTLQLEHKPFSWAAMGTGEVRSMGTGRLTVG